MSSFNLIARYYNRMTGFPARIARLTESVAPWVSEWNVREALDAGCGNGVLLFALQKLGVRAVGIDVAEPMLRLTLDNARERGVTVDIRSASYESLGGLFPSRFDAVFALGNGLVGAANEREMTAWLKGLHDSLRPGGHVLIQMLNLIPFLKGQKSLIMRRSVDGVTFTRFAKPAANRPGLIFCLTIEGPEEQFDAHVSHWPAWDWRRVGGCAAEAGFASIQILGSLARDPFDERTSTDLVIVAERSGRT
ncbi:MAG: class I SAM-dependent methyltransferase [Candidatus Zixiibacteriota bacterium]